MSFLGVRVGNKLGNKNENKVEILGGSILMLFGLNKLLEHLKII